MKLTANHKAGILYLLPVLALLGVWYILLSIHNPSVVNPVDNFLYLLNTSPYQQNFRWLLALPCLCLLLAISYFSRLAQVQSGALGLLVMGVFLALGAWFTVSTPIAIFVSVPLYYAFINSRQHLKRNA
jgi:hypothetical protein